MLDIKKVLPRLRPLVQKPIKDKVAVAEQLVYEALTEYKGRCCIAYSGGKDSELALWFALKVDKDVPVLFNNTGVEYPETIRFVHKLQEEWGFNLVETHADCTFWDCVKERGFPKTKSNRTKVDGKGSANLCCYHLKEKPAMLAMRKNGWDCSITGVTAIENRNRQINAITHGMAYTMRGSGTRKVHPILYWTPDEVFAFFKDRGIPINPLYSHPSGTVDRVGCSTCTAFKGWENQLSQVNPKLYQLIKKRMLPTDISDGNLDDDPCTMYIGGKVVKTCDVYGHAFIKGACFRCGLEEN